MRDYLLLLDREMVVGPDDISDEDFARIVEIMDAHLDNVEVRIAQQGEPTGLHFNDRTGPFLKVDRDFPTWEQDPSWMHEVDALDRATDDALDKAKQRVWVDDPMERAFSREIERFGLHDLPTNSYGLLAEVVGHDDASQDAVVRIYGDANADEERVLGSASLRSLAQVEPTGDYWDDYEEFVAALVRAPKEDA